MKNLSKTEEKLLMGYSIKNFISQSHLVYSLQHESAVYWPQMSYIDKKSEETCHLGYITKTVC